MNEIPTTVAVSPLTPVRCSECGVTPEELQERMSLVQYYIKRRRGLYALLCFQNGQGCWERSARTMCQNTDPHGNFQCPNLAEYEIRWLGHYRKSCVACLPDMLPQDVDSVSLFPLED